MFSLSIILLSMFAMGDSYTSPCNAGYWHVVGAAINNNKERKNCQIIVNVRDAKSGVKNPRCVKFSSDRYKKVRAGVRNHAATGICLHRSGKFYAPDSVSGNGKKKRKNNPK